MTARLLLVMVFLGTTVAAANQDPAVGRWTSVVTFGDGTTYGFELKADGTATTIRTATMRVERWRRIDARHIELSEVSEGVSDGAHTLSRRQVRYRVLFTKNGEMILQTPMGARKGLYAGTFRHTKRRIWWRPLWPKS
jgi:hypothetical protein